MLFKRVLIGLELREFDRIRTMRMVLTKNRFGKNQSYKVLTPDWRYEGYKESLFRFSS